MKLDLEAAGVAYLNEDGQADFHALRHTFLSRLGRSGCPAKVMQRLARHSTVELTIGRYTHASLYDLGAAVANLPKLPTGTDSSQPVAEPVTLRATGTDGPTTSEADALRPNSEQSNDNAAESVAPVMAPKLAQKLVQSPDGDSERLRVIRFEDARIDSEAEKQKALQLQGFESDCESLITLAKAERGGLSVVRILTAAL